MDSLLYVGGFGRKMVMVRNGEQRFQFLPNDETKDGNNGGTINGAYDGSNDKVSGTTGTSQVAAIDVNKNDRGQISLKFPFL